MTLSALSPQPATPLAEALVSATLDWVRATLIADAGVAEARKRLDALRGATPLDHLARTFNLAPVDEDLLLFALAHRIDGSIAALCGEAVGDPRQSYVTPHLLARTIGGGDPGFAAMLFIRTLPDAPLRRWSLVEMRETHALGAVTLTEGVALRLSGQQPGLPQGCRAIAPAATISAPVTQTLAEALANGLALVGPVGSGRRVLAGKLAETARLAVAELTTTPGPEAMAALARDARLDGLAILFDADPEGSSTMPPAEDPPAPDPGKHRRGWLRDAAELLQGQLIVLAEDPSDLPPDLHRVRVAALTVPERIAAWRTALPGWPAEERDAVARHFPLGPGTIAAIAKGLDPRASPGTLWQLCRDRGGHGLEGLATRIVPRFDWDDLILPDPIRRELRAIADQMRHRGRVYDDWGFSRRLAAGRGITALLAGPYGVGKTMAAEVIAGDLGLDLYKVDLSRLVSKYIGETEKNLRRVFDAAEATGACLFLDEADAVLGKRSEVKDSHDRHANIEVSYLLQRMESFAGLCLMATNLKNNLDAAFLRRLRFVVDIPLPDQGDRLRIWQGAFPPDTPTDGLDMAALSRLDISGGSIVVIAVNAAFLAAAEACAVRMDHIARAARGEYRKHDRSFRAPWDRGGR